MVMRDLNIGTKVGLGVLNDRWAALVLINLKAAPTEIMNLRQRVRGLSTLKLLNVLAKLTELGLVATAGNYQFQLTTAGVSFQKQLHQLEVWGDQMIVTMH
ncbi:HxlR family transcriptional regulator [Lactiplantibacillus plantarum]|mgnify:FL=1|nr:MULTISPECIES: winged helix-turn-helix transcriptional regulator [Lactiplantibacillus]AGL65171.2 Transcription regulator [Lactiplantibacillus plantarum subsp. plantarum P-8]AGO09001.1 HxlR family transcriptional regulator [Lactiplantibacillus plantarum 16]AQY70465.1 HxlR family transcriptional regulator [Lactiplantibacillus plantarum]ASD31585.1 HxlR family transcriptional regulator [Lactiplantibacillus plantarum]AUH38053.1 HxlR family transcriptional regulator [Lactiplantibacillus plantarum]